jgi:hypothetical protein
MNNFKDFDITRNTKRFVGEKVKMYNIVDKPIIVYAFKIEDSKCFQNRGTGKCLSLQISLNNVKHIIFTSATGLIDSIKQIPENKFPFNTTIVQDNKRFEFS